MIDRETLDARVLSGEDVPSESLIEAIEGDSPPQGDLLVQYARRLLQAALGVRDVAAAHSVAELMDTHPAVNAELEITLNAALIHEPDTVYAFIRAHLSESANPVWLERLRAAAVSSLQVAISAGNTETVMSWLTLIAREPPYYGLSAVLHDGILAARERAYQIEDLARQLLSFAAKRDGGALAILLADNTLISSLTNNIGRVLREHTGDPLMFLQNWGAELFLAALGRAAEAGIGDLFTLESIEKLWEMLAYRQPPETPDSFHPDQIIQVLIAQGVDMLTPEKYQAFVAQLLSRNHPDFFLQWVDTLTTQKKVLVMLLDLLEDSPRGLQDVLDRAGQSVGSGDMNPQQAADLYILLLSAREWRKTDLPAAEQLARLMQQPTLTVEPNLLLMLLNLASETRNELIVRTGTRRLVNEIEPIEDEGELVEELRLLITRTQWSVGTTQFILNWWRDFVRMQSFARLQRLDQSFEGKRGLDEARAILQSLIAIRKMIGQRTLPELAGQVKAAYSVLEDLSEAFDPLAKRAFVFDQLIVRAELDDREDQVSPHERKVLANNLKKLGQLIVLLSDNRTKTTLMRRGEELDRDLMTGEQEPHSAIDAMKWLAGYWDGTQTTPETES